jgi:hypothetical protein
MSGMRRWAMWAVCLGMLWGCDDGGGDDDGGGGGAAAAEPDAAVGPPGVPFAGDVATLAEPADGQSYFPMPGGGVWRFRTQTAEWQTPPELTRGAEVTLTAGEGEGEVVRRTVMISPMDLDGEEKEVRQVMEEVLIVGAADDAVGPLVQVKSVSLEERVVADQSFVRVLKRTYDPAYVLSEDAWKTGVLGTRAETSVQFTEELTLPGDTEPRVTQALVNVSVQTDTSPKTLPMEGKYRSEVFEVKIFDDVNEALTRSYWVQQGVGPIQWQVNMASTQIYTLIQTNLDGDWAP